jgi:hypothetical protein
MGKVVPGNVFSEKKYIFTLAKKNYDNPKLKTNDN